jgi:RNA polymerase primary sigma factor
VQTSQPAVSQWASGTKKPSPENLEALARVLRVRREWLETGLGRRQVVDEAAERAEYREQSTWAFRLAPPDGGRDYGNANVWSFDPGLDVLVREVLQNARDAGLSSGLQVEVVFRIIRLAGEDLRAYQEALRWADLRGHLDASTQNGQKLGTLIRDGLKQIEAAGELLLLAIEDSGTSGLVGQEKGEGKFTALCRNNLDSNKEGGGTKGGAFGLGKAVLWRASRLSTVLFSSHLSRPDEEGRSHYRLLGRCDLPWHQIGVNQFAGPGWFGRGGEGPGDAVSFWENETLARDLYLDRERSGTTACVVGFHDASSDQDRKSVELARDLVRSAADHFFPALVFGSLTVRVEVYENRRQYSDRRPGFSQAVNVDELEPQYCKMLRTYHDGATADRLGDSGEVVVRPVTLEVPKRVVEKKHGEFEHEAVLLVMGAAEGESQRANQLAMFRGPGMVIESVSLSGLCLGARPFHALLLCGKAPEQASDLSPREAHADAAAEEFLRTAEPPSHNRWIATPDLKSVYARGCKTKLEDFLRRAKDAVRDLVKPAAKDLGDGPQSLKELFRLGADPVPQERPRVVEQSGSVDDQGRWQVKARVRMKPRKTPVRLAPAVFFLAETGSGQAVAWEWLEPIRNCQLARGELLVPPDTREVQFRGSTDPRTHPVPAGESCVVVDIRKVTPVRGAAQ